MYKFLQNIDNPADIKKLNIEQLTALAKEIRDAIINRDSIIGGHVGPNLGIVETTIALHYVFNSPNDKIVWDVSHQCYPHKILTGRKDGFITDDGMRKISGYTNQDESEHDFFKIGHTSTSVSLACGLAKARDLKGEKHNVIAIIGDGSLSGGEAVEGLNNAAGLGSNLIIIINDNEMSIAENQGGLYTNLRLLRQTNGLAECNMFKALGFEYFYVANGNSIEDMIEVLTSLKDTNKPTVLHIHTLKGKGYKYAEDNKEKWHWSVPFNIDDGSAKGDMSGENINDLTYNYLLEKIKSDNSIVAVNAGTPGVFGLDAKRRNILGKNFVDVGIAEEHAVAFSSALAKGGAKPIYLVMSSFIQRTYDQLSQDLALNNNPAVIIVAWGGISGADMTHLCSFDISLISNIPNLVYLAPTTVEEYMAMLDWAIEQNKHPVIIRQPKKLIHTSLPVDKDYSNLTTYKIDKQGTNVAIIAEGSFFELGENVVKELVKHNIMPTLINPRYLTGIDKVCLENLKLNHQLVITLEDGELDGGFGEKITRFYGSSDMKVLNYGSFKEFTDRANLNELYVRYRLNTKLIVDDILEIVSGNSSIAPSK
ncbi:MAG: 1-deoxy-D-xylulose-5-phosphate synthase [Alphaproteobacteria bacterium]|nr:1-deoxy-D-xylulose-5-phosphate synthase [Alphaproteobacteria bacterium]